MFEVDFGLINNGLEIAKQQAPREIVMNKYLLTLAVLATGSMLSLAQPVITTQPVGQTNWLGGSVLFSVSATNSATLNYQWQFNSANLDFATNADLSLTNLSASNQGYYNVVVSDGVMVTTSDVVYLAVRGMAEALNTTNMEWETSGDSLWIINSSNWSHDGTASAVSAVPNPGQKSILQTTVS